MLRKLTSEGLLTDVYGPTNLRLKLDDIPLWRGDHVSVRQLVDDYAQYLYLQRLTDPEKVLPATVERGVGEMLWATETFAYAERWDDAEKRYVGLKGGQITAVPFDDAGVVVKPDIARRQMDADELEFTGGKTTTAGIENGRGSYATGAGTGDGTPTGGTGTIEQPRQRTIVLRRYHGSVDIDAVRAGRDAADITREIIQHLTSLPRANVRLTLEIEADLPEGAPEHVVRTVSENASALKFRDSGFEE